MKHKFLKTVLSTCFILSVAAGNALAQGSTNTSAEQAGINNKRTGTAAATELLIPVGGRGLALGGAMTTNAVGVDALHWNPAGLARMDNQAQGMFSSMPYIADINMSYGALALNFSSFGQVGVFVKLMDVGDIPLTTTDDPEGLVGRTYSPTMFTVGFSLARQFTDAITAGGTFKVISENLQRVQGTGVAIDVGIQYHGVAGFKGVNLGVVMRNFGPSVNFGGPALSRVATAADGRRPAQHYVSNAASFELPSSVEIGLAYVRQVNDALTMNLLGAYENDNLALDGYKGALELTYQMSALSMSARAGQVMRPTNEFDEDIFGITAGFGFTYATTGMDITFDYAYRDTQYFSNSNMFSIILGF